MKRIILIIFIITCLLDVIYSQEKNTTSRIDSTLLGVIKISKPTDSVAGDFSPNGDGIKDKFIFRSANVSKVSVEVIDATDNVMFKSEKLESEWDGRDLKGKLAKDGMYFYTVNAVGIAGKRYTSKGTIYLKR